LVNEIRNNRKRKVGNISRPEEKEKYINHIKMLVLDCYMQHKHVEQHLLLMMRQLEVLI
jgi:desulfoferrodoxin (superoxide reductase-like protein)